MRRLSLALLLLLTASAEARAQDDASEDEGSSEEAAPEDAAPEDAAPEDAAPEDAAPEDAAPVNIDVEDSAADGSAARDAPASAESEGDAPDEPATDTVPPVERPAARTPTLEAPKVAIVVVGDPDERLRQLARRVDDGLEPELRRPFDPGLRAALRGETGEDDDGLREVRRDRRRLSGVEAHDAPLLSSLGHRAGALVVAAIRVGDDGPELVILDVRHAAFYEGALPLGGSIEPARILEFIGRRARAAAHVESIAPGAVAADAVSSSDSDDPLEEEEEEEEGFLEQFWPYLIAGVLLAGMIAAIAATSLSDQPDQPVLRFVPGGG